MRVLLRDPVVGLYFQGLGQWTGHPREALDFEDVDEALELASGMGCKHCEVILIFRELPAEPQLFWVPSSAAGWGEQRDGRSDRI